MSKKAWIAAGLIGAVSGLVANFPMAWIGGFKPQDGLAKPLTYSGTVWHGQVFNLPLSGPLEIRTRPMGFVRGGTPISFQSAAPGLSLRGAAGPKQIKDLQYGAEYSVLPITDGRLVGLDGRVDLRIDEARFGAGCETLTGTLRTDVLTRNRARFQWQGPELSGPLSCENGEIVATLSGRDNRSDIEAVMHINLAGSYRLETRVTSRDPEAAALLPLYGFQNNGGRFTLTEQGQW